MRQIKTEDSNIHVFNMITGKSEPKILTKDILCNVNLMEEIVILIKSGIMINVDVSVKIWKNILCVKKIIFGILLHAVVKMVNTYQVLLTIQWLCVMKL